VPVLAAVAGLLLVQRLVPAGLREEHNDVAGFIHVVLGVAYAVLLAFVVIVVWQDYETAKTNVESEANELAGVYFLAAQFAEPERTRVQDLAHLPLRAQEQRGARAHGRRPDVGHLRHTLHHPLARVPLRRGCRDPAYRLPGDPP
jgi:hypothetical protein